MEKPSSSVSSGNIFPAIVGPNRDGKEVYILGGLVLFLAIVVGAFWYYSGQGQSYASKTSTEILTNDQVTNVLKTGTTPLAEPIAHKETVPASSYKSNPYRHLFRGGPQRSHGRRQGDSGHAGRLGEERSRPRHSHPGSHRSAGFGRL